MEQNKEMTAAQSLALITETMNNSRKAILRSGSKYFILWGTLLACFSLLIYFLWHASGSPRWNFLWFVLPIIGYPVAALVSKNDKAAPKSEISSLLGYVWSVFGVFSICLSSIAVFAVPMHMTLLIIVILGLAECISGVILKNWPIIIAGFILGVGGAVVAMLVKSEAQLLLFTLGGVLLAVTGFIVKLQYK